MKFLIDAQLPPALAQWMSAAGHSAQAVRDIGLRDSEDREIWDYALAHDLVIVTKDEDFIRRAQASARSPVIVWLRLGNTSNTTLRTWLVPRLPQLASLVADGHHVIEVR